LDSTEIELRQSFNQTPGGHLFNSFLAFKSSDNLHNPLILQLVPFHQSDRRMKIEQTWTGLKKRQLKKGFSFFLQADRVLGEESINNLG